MVSSTLLDFDWLLRPIEDQKIVKRCPGCEVKRSFVSSGAFRTNAQKKLLDVWHIYNCEYCNQTWNIEILSRVNRKKVDPAMYASFLQNDPAEIRRRTFDYQLLAKNRVELADPPAFAVEGHGLEDLKGLDIAKGRFRIEFPLPIRMAIVLTKKLGLSRRCLSHLIQDGLIRGITLDDLRRKAKEHDTIELDVGPILAKIEANRSAQPA